MYIDKCRCSECERHYLRGCDYAYKHPDVDCYVDLLRETENHIRRSKEEDLRKKDLEMPIVAQTEKAVLAKFRGFNLWVPKSEIIKNDDEKIIRITTKMFEKKIREAEKIASENCKGCAYSYWDCRECEHWITEGCYGDCSHKIEKSEEV